METNLGVADGKFIRKRKTWRRKLLLIATFQWWNHNVKYGLRVPKHDSELPGYKWMLELWNGNDHRFFEQFRMRKEVMAKLIHTLHTKYGFKPFEHVAIDESFGILMLIIGHALTFPNITERFQHSGQTISAHFHEMLAAVCRMGIDLIKPQDGKFESTPDKLKRDRRYFPAFAGCVGAIDGTHINLRLSGSNNYAWYDRHGAPSTTVLAVVDFDLCITYAKIGSEGSMHDSRVLYRALRETRMKFPTPPEGKYYLADAGFPNIKGFLVPYRKTRYHIPDFRQVGVIRNRNENFNYLHSSLRSMVERTFGILKSRFKILKHMTGFDMRTQLRIIWATMAIHNFLRKYDADDIDLLGIISDNEDADPIIDESASTWNEPTSGDALYMDNLRDMIRDNLPFHGQWRC